MWAKGNAESAANWHDTDRPDVIVIPHPDFPTCAHLDMGRVPQSGKCLAKHGKTLGDRSLVLFLAFKFQ